MRKTMSYYHNSEEIFRTLVIANPTERKRMFVNNLQS